MALPKPKLDDRQFQDIVDEAKKRIPHYCKEWTDHNVSDPGVTLIELFAWMTDMILYRLNQVPDLHAIRFMEMMGITLQGPVPAQVPVTFWLSQPQATPVLIPAGTEVASTQTETEPSIIFTTTDHLRVFPPELSVVCHRVTRGKEKQYNDQSLRRLQNGFGGFEVFTAVPQVDDALYFGFDNDLSQHIVGFDMDFDSAGGAGIDPTLPPYVWEASTGNSNRRWRQCEIDTDTTKGMNVSGRMHLHVPTMGRYDFGKGNHFWLRIRIKDISSAEQRDGMQRYEKSPLLKRAAVATWGGTVEATHAQRIEHEFLGQSDGSPGQTFRLQATPVLKRASNETLLVHVDGNRPDAWEEVTDFADSDAQSKHFTLDSVNGTLRLGPAVRQPDGAIKLYGAVPPRNANLIFKRYRVGGGQVGNVQAGVLNTLKTAIPYISRVSNRQPAWGGLDAETLESAMMRLPAVLRSRDRAVTEADFEYLAMQAIPAAIGRVKCLQPDPSSAGRVAPGHVYVLVIPRVANPDGYIDPEQLKPDPEDINKLETYLDERRLITTRIDIRPPAFYWVTCKVELRAAPGMDETIVENRVLSRLYRFLNPLTGGENGTGWTFGRDLYVSDVYQSLQGIEGVQFIRGVEMRAARVDGRPHGDPLEILEVIAHGVIASGLHSVKFV